MEKLRSSIDNLLKKIETENMNLDNLEEIFQIYKNHNEDIIKVIRSFRSDLKTPLEEARLAHYKVAVESLLLQQFKGSRSIIYRNVDLPTGKPAKVQYI